MEVLSRDQMILDIILAAMAEQTADRSTHTSQRPNAIALLAKITAVGTRDTDRDGVLRDTQTKHCEKTPV